MAHPKRRTGSARQGKRRAHDKAAMPALAICQATGEYHLYHRAHWSEGKLYYKGKVIIDKQAEKA